MSDRILSNRYSLESEIGRGGMGVVYKATDTEVKRTVAVKTLPAVMSHNQDLMRRFTSEVQHASKLEHPNIVRVYDVGEDDGTHFYVMQYIDGSDLRSQMKSKGRYSVDETISIISQVADALDYAHSQRVVHRDIKPGNVLLDSEGNAHVADFGIAKATEGTRTTRGMLGTPEYMSPEQVRGKSVDGRSDQYSLAVVAYEMLTGRTPFKTEGDDPWAQINMHLNTPVPNPRTTVPDIPTHVANALLQTLAKKPEQRFDSCSELVRALKGEIEAVVPKVEAVVGYRASHVRRLAAVAVGAVAVLGVILLGLRGMHPGARTGKSKSSVGSEMSLRIAYIDRNSSTMDALCTMNPDGTDRRRICWFAREDWHPVRLRMFVSTLGDSFVYYDPDVRQVVLLSDAKTMKRLSFLIDKGPKAERPGPWRVSLDKTRIMWLQQQNDGVDLCCYDTRTHKASTISSVASLYTGPELYYASPRSSPDGKRLALIDKNGSFKVCDANGSGVRTLAAGGDRESDVCFIDGGSTLLLAAHRWEGEQEYNHVSKCDLETGQLTPVAALNSRFQNGRLDLVGASGEQVVIAHRGNHRSGRIILYVFSHNLGKQRRVSEFAEEMQFKGVSEDGNYVLAEYAKIDRDILSIGTAEMCIVDLRTGKTNKFDHAIPIGWVTMRNGIGAPVVSKSAATDYVPKGHSLIQAIGADLDGDGNNEKAYLAAASQKKSFTVWVERASRKIGEWRFAASDVSAYGGDCIYNETLSAIDVTGDDIPEVCFTCGFESGGGGGYGLQLWRLDTTSLRRVFGCSVDTSGDESACFKPAARAKAAEFVVIRGHAETKDGVGHGGCVTYYRWNGRESAAEKQPLEPESDGYGMLEKLEREGYKNLNGLRPK